jgi:glutamate dehydrogenase/leucine dehydrogenase
VVAASDITGAVYDPDGLDVPALVAFKRDHSVAEYTDAKSIDRDSLLTLDCDVLVPAAQPDVLDEGNVDRVRAPVILSGANIPATTKAEAMLHERGVLCVPDFIANAGGVICAAVEWRGGSQTEAFALIDERIGANTLDLMTRISVTGEAPRPAAESMAWARLADARRYRRSF